MGKKAIQVRSETRRAIQRKPLSQEEHANLRKRATYEGSPYHKRNPGDFGLVPPSSPRPDATLCDEAGIFKRSIADALFQKALNGGLVSENKTSAGFPKQLWVVDENGQVFEAMEGGSLPGTYHGYPIRKSDCLFEKILEAWRNL